MTSALLILAGALGVAMAAIVAILTALVATEARGNVPVLCRRLMDRTAARLPAEMQDRREEWESELADAADRPITQMAVAVRIWRSGRALAQEATDGVTEVEKSDGQRGQEASGLVSLLSSVGRPVIAGRRTLGSFLGSGSGRIAAISAAVSVGILVFNFLSILVPVFLLLLVGFLVILVISILYG